MGKRTEYIIVLCKFKYVKFMSISVNVKANLGQISDFGLVNLSFLRFIISIILFTDKNN